MTPVTLYRIDPTRNMQRYYRLDILTDLFGNHCLALAAFQKQRGVKERKGYATA